MIKSIIEQVELDPNWTPGYSHPATQDFAIAIVSAVNQHYSTRSARDTRGAAAAYTLQYSAALDIWTTAYDKYNCYVYSLGKTDTTFRHPGYYSGQTFQIWYPLQSIVNLVMADLYALNYSNVSTTTTRPTATSLGYNEKAICLRRGIGDYHFMRLEGSYWHHKPGNSAPLVLNYGNPGQITWTNERVNAFGPQASNQTYDSQIIYIIYS